MKRRGYAKCCGGAVGYRASGFRINHTDECEYYDDIRKGNAMAKKRHRFWRDVLAGLRGVLQII
jgi:hypothetical protein